MSFRTSLVVAGLIALPSVALAQEAGYYVKLFAGTSSLSDTSVSFGGTVTDPDVAFDSGTFAGGAVGYNYGGPISAELEFAYRSGDAGNGSVSGGDLASTALMINGVYSFDQGTRLTPYVGAGLGFVTEVDFDVPTGANAGEYSARGGLAGQLFAGVSWSVTDRVAAFGEVRYFDAGGQTLDGPGGAALDADYSTVDIGLGLTIGF